MSDLAKNQPCGCVVCYCENGEKCLGCGAKNCGTHPVGKIPNPVFAAPSPKVDMGPCGLSDMDDREAFKSYCDGNRAPWVESRLAAVAYRMLLSSTPPDPSSATREAVETLSVALRTDPGYWLSWEANIAMAFKDEVARNPKASVHEQANAAAKNFLTMITRLAALDQEKPK